MKDFEYYSKTNVIYPQRSDYNTTFWYKNGALVAKKTNAGPVEYMKSEHQVDFDFLKTCVQEQVVDMDAFKKHKEEYYKNQQSLQEEFVNDCFDYFGLQDNPGRHVIFDEAYDRGHSGGFSEVFNCMISIVNFVERLQAANKT